MEGAPWVISTRFTWDILGSIVTRTSTVNEVRYLSGVGHSYKGKPSFHVLEKVIHYTYFMEVWRFLVHFVVHSSFWFW